MSNTFKKLGIYLAIFLNFIGISKCSDNGKSRRGSVLVLVLWILVIISFLSSEYIAHNREKTSIAINTTELFKRESAAFSVLELIASPNYDLLKIKSQEENADFDSDTVIDGLSSKSNKDKDNKSKIGQEPPANNQNYTQNAADSWVRLRPGGVEVWVKVEDESSKMQLTLGQEQNIRNALQNIYGEDREKEAEIFADAILDWLDPDDLVRLNGAESEYYNNNYPPCDPANAPFKSISEIFLVKDFDSDIFWGSQYEYVLQLPIYSELRDIELSRNYSSNRYKTTNRNSYTKSNSKASTNEEGSETLENYKMQTILELFTIYEKSYKRVSMLFPSDNDRWYNEIFWVKKDGNSITLVEQLSRVMVVKVNID
ncbi:MAG: general secretion pathway protein GspK [Desulfamplus sp.]|nr:general secretion pathway protein GspK [Desulfamplus sp.]